MNDSIMVSVAPEGSPATDHPKGQFQGSGGCAARPIREPEQEMALFQAETIRALMELADSRDENPGGHTERMAAACRLIAAQLRRESPQRAYLDDAYLEHIATASRLHDIGKVGVPDAILHKPGILTNLEFEIMKSHAMIGYEVLSGINRLFPENAVLRIGMDIARYHHEKWDGSGYPDGLAGEEIPLPARIAALADVYDALRSRRAYKAAYSHRTAIGIIDREQGLHFDPVLVDAFRESGDAIREIYDRSR